MLGRMPATRWRQVLQLALLVVLAWQLLGLASSAASRNLSFDGGMNLEVSKSIANGLGPRGRYDDGPLYPPGVQSKEPFFLVGAAVFKLAGVGPVQAQATNFLFLLLLTLLVVRVVAKVSDLETGLLAAIFVLAMPQLHWYGLSGYGEVATMCFGLAALTVIAWPERLHPGAIARPCVAGALAGLAVATKVVGVVQLAAIALVLALRAMADADTGSRIRSLLRAGVAFAAGVALPLVLIEAWRMHWLGRDGYAHYWAFQLDSIRAQSGAEPRLAQAPMLDKVPMHFAVLEREFGRGALATFGLLLVPFVAIAAHLRTARDQNRAWRWLVVGLMLIACAYLPWWLAIVPTNKAWVRYLYIALLAMALLAAIGTLASAREAIAGAGRSSNNIARRLAHAVLVMLVGVLYLPFVARSLLPLDFSPNAEVQATQYAARLISSLPKDRQVFGYGWYAAPVIQIYSDRAFLDLTDWPIGRLLGKPAYIVSDRAELQVKPTSRVLQRYPHRMLMRPNPFAQVYEVDFAHPLNPFSNADASGAATYVDFSKTPAYPLVSGYEPWEPMGGRFVESDSEILLRYNDQNMLSFTGYAALPRYYLRPQPLRGRVVIDGCPAMPFGFEGPSWKKFDFVLVCKPEKGAAVRIRILLDNVFDLPLLYDRQRGFMLREVGFTD